MAAVMRTVSGRVFHATVVTLAAAALPTAALAQTTAPPSKWTIEAYGGSTSASDSTSGTAGAAFPVGVPFTTAAGFPSRAQMSWYFGDGSKMLNDLLTRFEIDQNVPFSRIVPLDAAVQVNGVRRQSGAAFGVRLTRTLSSKAGLEFSVERSLGSLGFTEEMLTALEATRASFEAAFEQFLGSAPATNVNVDSLLTLPDAKSAQTKIAASARWSLVSGKKAGAYATLGAGVVMNGGSGVQAVLNGGYNFRSFGTAPMSESDRVVVRAQSSGTALMGLVGGGITYAFSSRSGLSADLRLALSPNNTVTTVGASAGRVAGSPAAVLETTQLPVIQFSNQPAFRTTLSGDPGTLTTFTGSGLNRQVSFTLGLFRRF
jgi:hypothetical protein